jgi:hypothetical protein
VIEESLLGAWISAARFAISNGQFSKILQAVERIRRAEIYKKLGQ